MTYANQRLTSALQHLAGENPEHTAQAEALNQLVKAWKETRAPEIAELIDTLSLKMDFGETLVDEADGEEAHQAWVKVRRGDRPEDLWRLLLSLGHDYSSDVVLSMKRFQSLAWVVDPRLSSAIADMFFHRSTPINHSHTTDLKWARALYVADMLARLGDKRTVSTLQAIDANHSPYGWSMELCHETAKKIAAIELRPLASEDMLLCEKISQALSKVSAEDEMLDAVANDVQNDAPRQAYAEWIREHGDPERAEFITLQLLSARGEATQPQRDREEELLTNGKQRWLGPLAHTRGYATFERGFLIRADLEPAWFKRRLLSHRILSTIQETNERSVECLESPALRNITAIATTPETAAEMVVDGKKNWTVLTLGATHDGGSALPEPGTIKQLPKLQRLGIEGLRSYIVSIADKRCESILEERPLTLQVHKNDSAFDEADSFAAFFSEARTSRFSEVTLIGTPEEPDYSEEEPEEEEDPIITCKRDDDGQLSIVQGSAASLLCAKLHEFPEGSLTRVIIEEPSTEDAIAKLRKIVASINECTLETRLA